MTARRRLLVAWLLLANLCGCVSIELQPADRAALASASIDPNVPVTGDLDLRDPRMDFVSLWGSLYASYEAKQRAAETSDRIEQAHIAMGELARQEFEAALSRAQITLAAGPSPTGAVFHLEVQQIGLKPGNPYGDSVQPLVDVRATLVDASGRTLWRERGLVQAAFWEDTPAHEYDELVANPELLREAFAVAFRLASEDLVESLRGE